LLELYKAIYKCFPFRNCKPARHTKKICSKIIKNKIESNTLDLLDKYRCKNFVLLFWNGGGSMAARMRVNPEIQNAISFKPDIFAYAECLVYKSSRVTLPHYSLIIHKAKQYSSRRGLAIFFRNEHTHNLSQDFSSRKYDIIWLRYEYLSKASKSRKFKIFCFFYSPGENHTEQIRSGFYEELAQGWGRYPKGTEIFMLGDSNARLGGLLSGYSHKR